MNTESLRILLVAGDWPFPANHGARVDVWGTLRALSALGHRVDFVATVKTTPSSDAVAAVAEHAASVRFVQRRANSAGVLSMLPVQVATRTPLRNVPLSGQYDAVLLEGDFGAPILDNPHLQCRRRILRVHNDESSFFKQLASSARSAFERVYYRVEAARCRRWCPKLMKRVDELWFISLDHHQEWLRAHPAEHGRGHWLPPSAACIVKARRQWDDRQVLFAGNLTVPTNIEGLEWYLERVHPVLRRVPDYRLVIAGSTPDGTVPERLAARLDSSCTLVVNAPDLTACYASSAVFINPMLKGASLKLKTVNAVEHGLPVVCTSVGNEGTGLIDERHLLVRDTAQDFSAAVLNLLSNPSRALALTEQASAYVNDRYDHQRNLAALLGRNS